MCAVFRDKEWEPTIAWEQMRSVDVRRNGKGAIQFLDLTITTPEGKCTLTVSLRALDREAAEQVLEAVKLYHPDAEAPWQDQLAARGL